MSNAYNYLGPLLLKKDSPDYKSSDSYNDS